ncbi:hypothetical protein GPECTOR_7g1080 [Gonium pectorale]|uniref:Uncharacterized protein n=1 Tax=Gonium pectorale TaxID=33097 RepID=A0A150GU22_GONPE|nr:hypothetical protein GPECTOR_7g1080 [Gonium pectorale]|eukprot:KXZ53188.1 hypothetical protein GPECTOR_7g1080 [Gonium pectorale]
MFDPSYLLGERLRSAEAEVRRLKLGLANTEAERDSLRDDMQQLRDAKLAGERRHAELSGQMQGLERDVAFFKDQAAQAMAARESEIDRARAASLYSEARLAELSQALEVAQSANKDLQTHVEEVRGELEALREQQQQRERQAAAQKDTQAEVMQLLEKVQQLEASDAKLKAQLADVQAEAMHTQLLLRQAHKIEDQLNSQVKELQARGGQGDGVGRVRELELLLETARGELQLAHQELAAAREELERERGSHEEEREQLQLLGAKVHELKIKFAQATQEKVEALMRAAQLSETAAAAQRAAGPTGGAGGSGQPIPRLASAASYREHSRHAGKDLYLSRSPGSTSSQGLLPAASAPSPGGQPLGTRSWGAWLSGASAGWYGSGGAGGHSGSGGVGGTAGGGGGGSGSGGLGAAGVATLGAGAYANNGGSATPTYAPSVASEDAFEPDGGAAAVSSSSFSAAAQAAAAAASIEAAEARNRLLSEQLERLRSQLSAVDRLAGRVAERLSQLRGCAALLWSDRPEDAPRRWTALGELNRLAEACAALRAEAGLPEAATPSAAATAQLEPASSLGGSGGVEEAGLPPVVPLGPDLGLPPRPPSGRGLGGGGAAAAAGNAAPAAPEYDSSLVCTRESGGVQRRVAEALLAVLEFGVRSLERYNHQSALSSVQLYG